MANFEIRKKYQLEIDVAQFETGYIYHERMNERYKPTYLKVTEIGSFEVRYDIQPDLLFDMLYEKIEEVRERKDLIHHLICRESYLKQKLIEEYKLAGIERGYGLPVSKMVDCCQRLVRSGVLDFVNLENCKILISKEYKRHFDGNIVFRWDWK